MLRGQPRGSPATTARTSTSARTSTRQAGAVTPPYFTYHHSAKVVAGRELPDRQLVDRRPRLLACSGGTYPGRLRRRAVLRRLLARLHLGRCSRAPTACPTRPRSSTFVAGAANPVDLQIGPGGDLFYVDFDGGTIRRIRYPAATSRRRPSPTANPTSGAAPLTVSFDGTGSSDPDPATRSRYAWDLDGDGAVRRLDRRADATLDLHAARHRTPSRLRVTDTRGALGTDTVDDHAPATRAPTATIDDADGRRRPGSVGDVDRLLGLGDATSRTARCRRRGLALDADARTTAPRRLPHAHRADLRRRGERLVHGARPRVPVVTSSSR